MKITFWVLSTCIPERGEKPCHPQVFGSLTDAEAAADAALREEWTIHGLFDEETGDLLPYPGNWREAHNAIAKSIGDGSWGEWEITTHEIEIADPLRDAAPDMLAALHDLLTRPTDGAARQRARDAITKAEGHS